MERSNLPDDVAARAEGIGRWVEAVCGDERGLCDALVDRWPTAMVREGFSAHRQTWGDVEGLLEGLERELRAVGGFEAFEIWTSTSWNRRLRVRLPGEIVHFWPSLPGAGMTPVLYGGLLGVEQAIRPSRRDSGFAEFTVERWSEIDALPPLELRGADSEQWLEADVVVVSGSDSTLRSIQSKLVDEQRVRATRVTGYGHRVSLGVVPSGDGVDLEDVADGFARDAVLWNQAGCFSLRGVLVAGDRGRFETFCRALGARIASWEGELDAVPSSREEASIGVFDRRIQQRQVAEFEGRLYGPGFGWAEARTDPFAGEWISLHTVTCHRVDGPTEIADAVELEPRHLQGAAIPNSVNGKEWRAALASAGVTRICAPGTLQSPPPYWLHDGRPNVLQWVRTTTRD